MAEKKEIQFENVKKIGLLAGDDEIGALLEGVRKSQKDIADIIRGLNEKAKELNSARAAAALEEAYAAAKAAESAPDEEPSSGSAAENFTEPAPVSDETPEKAKASPKKKEDKKAPEKAPAEETAPAEPVPPLNESADKKDKKTKKDKKEPAAENAEASVLPSFIVKKADPNAAAEDTPKKIVKKEFIPSDDRREKKSYPPRGGAAPGKKPAEKQVRTFVSGETSRFAPPAMPQKEGKGFGQKKKAEKNYEEKKAVNKRALIKTQITAADFDEDKTGYRKLRTKKQKADQSAQTVKIEKAVITSEMIPIKTLSEKIGVSAVEITKKLFKEGIIKTINDTIDYDTAAYISADIGVELELKLEKTAEDVLSALAEDAADDESKLVRRPPVVTVMGHVDHGKTSLLDKIRSSNVTAGEAGGITQHIGAYTVSLKGNQITFIDTPGHAAFTAMRARGAQVTDIAIIVIAADDGIMPQTIEAINHAKAANVSIIVAANKIDKPTANIDRIRQQLTEHDILVEDWGGDVILAPVSAKTGEGIPELLETIQLVAEMRDLKANPDRMAKGTIIEAQLDKGKGPVATVLIQNGTLKTGDNIVAGTVVGRVRAMIDDKGRTVKSAGPSMAVSILGLEEVPNAGDSIYAVEQEKLTKLVAQERRNKEREDMIRQTQRVSLDDLFNKIAEGKQLSLNIIVKADVQGSVEAVKQSLIKLSNDEVKVNVIHAAVGAISETDVMLADSSNSVIIGFNVRPDSNAKAIAERRHIDVKLYKIIYEAIEDVQKAMKGLLAPKYQDVYMGKAEVRNTFNITGVGTVAGCYVTEGKIVRSGGKLRIYRNDILICEGNVLQLKRFKDDVKEVAQGFECGMSIENFNDIKIGDFIECYITEEIKD
ncbi:MAG: translation initiation factor IF-2 [Clostridia bacterium]|nr:translation initiation factor IF-2 [Clostridia bacterium]